MKSKVPPLHSVAGLFWSSLGEPALPLGLGVLWGLRFYVNNHCTG